MGKQRVLCELPRHSKIYERGHGIAAAERREASSEQLPLDLCRKRFEQFDMGSYRERFQRANMQPNDRRGSLESGLGSRKSSLG